MATRQFRLASVAVGDWLSDLDSNQDKSLQRALCYRYTIGQTAAKLACRQPPAKQKLRCGRWYLGGFRNRCERRSRQGYKAEWVALVLWTCSAVGVGFGIYPAWKAANFDSLVSLRYECAKWHKWRKVTRSSRPAWAGFEPGFVAQRPPIVLCS